ALQSGVTDKYKLFIVVDSIKDAYKLAENCPEIDKINLGGIKAKEGSKNIGKAVNVLPAEEELLRKMVAKGIAVDIRQVPSDKKVAVEDVL
ncbi:PTS mannose/fructose/sorbose transporter subunit IIB, partial [Listeria monocytogenes]|nr:PTS mannose/fructose/sorbose transporter subunit IIB [Listeria monocytogenes]